MTRDLRFSHEQLELVAQKSHAIRQRCNSLAEGKHGRVSAKLAVIEKDRVFGGVGRLQPGSHLAGMERIAVPVRVTGDDHRGGVGYTISNLMVRRVFREGGEVVWIFDGAEFLFPNVRVIEQVIP